MLPRGVQLALDHAHTERRIRLGTHWVKNTSGRQGVIAPRDLPFNAFTQWLQAEAYNAIEALLLDEAYPRPTAHPLSVVWCAEDALERLAAPASPGARESAQLTALLSDAEGNDQLHRLLTAASPRAQQLFRLVSEGLSITEAASVIGMSSSTAYVHYHRTRKKVNSR
jgi:DNA-directed RNA polymerase specialized sigma24 family protein